MRKSGASEVYGSRCAISLESLERIGNWLPDTVRRIAAERDWRILYIDAPTGPVQVLDLNSVAPGFRERIVDAAVAHGEPLYEELPADVIESTARSAKSQIHAQKVVSIETIRAAAAALKNRHA